MSKTTQIFFLLLLILNTPYLLAQKVSEYAEWNLQNVNHYQRWLVEQAVSTWTIDIKE